jgi:hypothetical protein
MFGIGLAQISIERAEHGRRRRDDGILAVQQARQIDAGDEARVAVLSV